MRAKHAAAAQRWPADCRAQPAEPHAGAADAAADTADPSHGDEPQREGAAATDGGAGGASNSGAAKRPREAAAAAAEPAAAEAEDDERPAKKRRGKARSGAIRAREAERRPSAADGGTQGDDPGD